jgi:hypothetical protein
MPPVFTRRFSRWSRRRLSQAMSHNAVNQSSVHEQRSWVERWSCRAHLEKVQGAVLLSFRPLSADVDQVAQVLQGTLLREVQSARQNLPIPDWCTVTVIDGSGGRHGLDVYADISFDASHLYLTHVIRLPGCGPPAPPTVETTFEVGLHGVARCGWTE